MTELAISKTSIRDIKKTLGSRPLRLNEQVYIRKYGVNTANIMGTLRNHCEIVQKCGYTPEIEVEGETHLKLYAARRRSRNKHD